MTQTDGGTAPPASELDQAMAAYRQDDPDTARVKVLSFIRSGRMAPSQGAFAVELLRALGMTEQADELRDTLLRGIDQALAEHSTVHSVHFECGQALKLLQLPQRAITAFEQALKMQPADPRPAQLLIELLLQADEPDRLVIDWLPTLNRMPVSRAANELWSCLAIGLGFYGYRDHAVRVSDMARQVWHGDMAAWKEMDDGLRSSASDQPSLTQAGWDAFAGDYDSSLAAIGNNGPRLIAGMLERLGWTPEKRLDIFDAGCGTGLCAPILRPFAKRLVGGDFSTEMLERSRARGLYDDLLRSDLNNAATLPRSRFDLWVAADVFPYFGNLEAALANLAGLLRPGGWAFFTVEEAKATTADTAQSEDKGRGWERYASGRFRHRADYVQSCLSKAGFAPIAEQFLGTLRHEFGQPIEARCIAAHRLSSFGTLERVKGIEPSS